ncbi:MAG: RT0821/Lpp0805 family surface protein [Alphaproteobacteria bacterium]|nr:RT0821/Lpp0805 family surface protein [Alphaproteobacteria bacterium]
MRFRQLIGLTVVTGLGGCAMLGNDQTALYGAMNDQDVQLAATTMQATLEAAPDGVTRRWQNETTGHNGAITPTRTYQSAGGYYCRDYVEEITMKDQQARFEHTACRVDDERWAWI